MTFNIPKSKYGEIQDWFINVLETISFIQGVPIYESNYFIDTSIKIPAIALQRDKIEEETDPNEICVGQNSLKTNVAITLHIPPTEKETLDPILYYFEETVFKEIINAYLTGNLPSHLNYLKFRESYVSNMFTRDSNTAFSNLSRVIFDIGFAV